MEDIFHASRHTRSKADYYHQHLFLKILVHELKNTEQAEHRFGEGIPRSTSPLPFDDEKTLHASRQSSTRKKLDSINKDEEDRLSANSLMAQFNESMDLVRSIATRFSP